MNADKKHIIATVVIIVCIALTGLIYAFGYKRLIKGECAGYIYTENKVISFTSDNAIETRNYIEITTADDRGNIYVQIVIKDNIEEIAYTKL